MKTYIGIDFGACNIKAFQINNGRELSIRLDKQQSGKEYIPNIILYDKHKGKLENIVGKIAKRDGKPQNKVWQIKPKISKKNWSKYIENLGREVNAAEVVKDILDCIWRTITNQFAGEKDFDVTITAPVSFSEVQKNLIKQAALDAGIPVTTVITEPFAAMFSLEDFLQDEDKQTVLIFDFGGSTLDLSLFRIERADDELRFTELAAAGLKFGGLDIDKAIFENIFMVKYADEVKKILDNGTPKIEFLNAIESIKESIFEDDEDSMSEFVKDNEGGLIEFNLTKDEIISVLEKIKIKEKIIAVFEELFEDAKIKKSEVTAVKPFGGTSTISYFLEMLTDYFGAEVFDCEDFDLPPDEIYMGVAKGAAKYRYTIEKENSGVTIKNVIPYSIGLAKNKNFTRYIKRNEISGFVTRFESLLISELEKNNWRVAVYQSFSNEFKLPLDSEEVIFMCDVELDKNLYSVEDAILFKMKTDSSGKIHMKFFEFPPDSDEPKLIEEKFVKVG